MIASFLPSPSSAPHLGHLGSPLASSIFSKPVSKATGKLCTQAPSSLALIYHLFHVGKWPLLVLDAELSRLSCQLGWLLLLFVIVSCDGKHNNSLCVRCPLPVGQALGIHYP